MCCNGNEDFQSGHLAISRPMCGRYRGCEWLSGKWPCWVIRGSSLLHDFISDLVWAMVSDDKYLCGFAIVKGVSMHIGIPIALDH